MNSKSILSAVLAVLVLAGVGLIVWYVFRGAQPFCELTNSAPEIDNIEKLDNIGSSDSIAVANFAGYFAYEPQNDLTIDLNSSSKTVEKANKFMMLSLDSIKVGIGLEGRSIIMDARCANITLNLRETDPKCFPRVVYVEEVQVKFPIGVTCTASTSIEAVDIERYHYFCNKTMEHYCMWQGQLVGRLVINKLEFELRDKPDEANKNRFRTEIQSC